MMISKNITKLFEQKNDNYKFNSIEFADLQRLFIQEKGENDYYYLLQKKTEQVNKMLSEEFYREELINKLKH
jgi:hypothetical protein